MFRVAHFGVKTKEVVMEEEKLDPTRERAKIISYARDYDETLRRLYTTLNKQGVKAYIDEAQKLEPGILPYLVLVNQFAYMQTVTERENIKKTLHDLMGNLAGADTPERMQFLIKGARVFLLERDLRAKGVTEEDLQKAMEENRKELFELNPSTPKIILGRH